MSPRARGLVTGIESQLSCPADARFFAAPSTGGNDLTECLPKGFKTHQTVTLLRLACLPAK